MSQAYLTTANKARLNTLNRRARKAGLGDIVEDIAADLDEVKDRVSSKGTYETFPVKPIQAADTGGTPTGTTGDINCFSTGANGFEWHVKGTQTIVQLSHSADGLEVAQDKTDNDGIEITQGITARSKSAFIAGTDRCFFEARLKVADVSGTDDCAIGFRKAEGYQAAIDNYDEMAALNVISGNVTVETILNNAATVSTDTTLDVADTETVDLRVEVDHVAGLAKAITLANSLKNAYNAHIANTDEHVSADATNVVTAPDAHDLTSLIALTTELLTDYDAHEGDSELVSDWLYHVAQEGGNVSLASTTAPTDLPACIARLNDFKSKFNSHDADGTAHDDDSIYQVSTPSARSVTFKVGIDDGEIAEIPVAAGNTSAFTFDNGEVIVPFLYFLHASDVCDTLHVQKWECGLLD